jgi:hypothetical protein
MAGTSERLVQLKATMDRLAGQVDLPVEASPEARQLFADALKNFTASGPELVDQATPFLWQYFHFVADEFTPAQRAEYSIPEIFQTDDIWLHVQFRHPPALELGGLRLEPGQLYLSYEGEVSWEPEHGLQLVFEDGQRVCKVGPYDGHNTVAHAYGDEALLGVIFK